MVKIASRFPVKANKALLGILMLSHIILVILGFVVLESGWKALLLIALLVVSFYFSIKNYRQITHSPSDLCWSGEFWLIQDELSNQISYLSLQRNSWITRDFSLLKFSSENKDYCWLFTRRTQGDRSYRALCLIAKGQLDTLNQKINSKLTP